jgi:hypothetical protein
MRFTGEWGFTYIRGIGYARSLWLDHGLQLLWANSTTRVAKQCKRHVQG